MANRGVNRVILIATAGNDAEMRFMPSGAAVANVSLATNEEWTDKQTGQKQSRTEWHRVAFMDRGNFRLGQIAGDYIKKGSKVYVEGSLRTREWEKDGVKRYTTEIVANELQLLDGKPEGQEPQSQGQQNQAGGQQQGFNQPNGQGGEHKSYGALDEWAAYETCGTAAGKPMQQIKNQPNVKGDLQKALQMGWIKKIEPSAQQSPNFDDFDDDIPFS